MRADECYCSVTWYVTEATTTLIEESPVVPITRCPLFIPDSEPLPPFPLLVESLKCRLFDMDVEHGVSTLVLAQLN